MALSLYFFWGTMFTVMCQAESIYWWKETVFPVQWSVVYAPLPKGPCDQGKLNFLNHVSWQGYNCTELKGPWDEKPLIHFHVCLLMKKHCDAVILVYCMCLFQSCTIASFRALPYLSQKLPSAVYILFVFPYYGCQVTLHHSLYVTPFQSEFLSKILRDSFSIWSESTAAIYGLSFRGRILVCNIQISLYISENQSTHPTL
jgi:hypothetical protein